MKSLRLLLIVCGAAVLAGCGTPPKSAAELRKDVKAGATGTTHDTFTVRRPFRLVASEMKRRWEVCLDQRVTLRTPDGYGGYDYDNIQYRPSASGNGHHMSLVLQWNRVGGRKAIGPTPPPGGFYEMVIDIDAEGSRATKVAVYNAGGYGLAGGLDSVSKQARMWAEGRSNACPALTE